MAIFFEVPKVVQKRGQYLHFPICPDVRWAKRVGIYNTYLCTVLPCLFFLPKVIRYVQLTLARPWPLYSDKCLCIMWCKYVCTSIQQWMLTVIRNDCIYIKNEKCCKNMTRGQLVQKLYWVGIDGWLISSLWSIDCIFPLFQLLTNVTRSLLFCQIFFTFHCPTHENPPMFLKLENVS